MTTLDNTSKTHGEEALSPEMQAMVRECAMDSLIECFQEICQDPERFGLDPDVLTLRNRQSRSVQFEQG
ncbi:hypothetical protein [Candidatus Endoriftia persephonae]|jgi:hypothetical protein|uniref:Uncharacterized protein n=1 Tax=Candidatus Endoriftia persephonae TaxID=393765 RepID=A0A9J7A2H5_9GAMM|nr:hypothetical protein [Candidatus Endoriftia persephone]USF89143.1 hypothetical protein L0Y14_07915 [Candidatus Endoriftia persephone]